MARVRGGWWVWETLWVVVVESSLESVKLVGRELAWDFEPVGMLVVVRQER